MKTEREKAHRVAVHMDMAKYPSIPVPVESICELREMNGCEKRQGSE